jgi:hypothetical protein
VSRWAHTSGVFRATLDAPSALRALGVPEGIDVVHHFDPHGVSWVRIAPDRRAALHSWPEHGVVTVDVYGPVIDLTAALSELGWEIAAGGTRAR